jgi:hypothetical protein
MNRLAVLLASAALLIGPARAQPQPEPSVTDQERDAFRAALVRGDADGIRAIIGPFLLLTDGNARFERSTAEALVDAIRGCRLIEADRIGTAPDMWYRFACPHRPRTGLSAWEDAGYYVRLWHHPSGNLVAFYYPGPVEARTRPRMFPPPVPRMPPVPRPNP